MLDRTAQPIKWYNNHTFPLIPKIVIKGADNYNTSGFSFNWLFFKLWTIDSLCFELSIVADNHWGLGLIGLCFYFRWVIAIPCPAKFGMWIDEHFSRGRRFLQN